MIAYWKYWLMGPIQINIVFLLLLHGLGQLPSNILMKILGKKVTTKLT